MMFTFPVLLIFLLSIFQVTVSSDSENGLLKYRTDLDKIGFDVENFLYNVAKEILQKANTVINTDYDKEYEDSNEEKETVPNEIKKEKGEDNLNTTPATVSVIEDYTETDEERRKRSVPEDYPLGEDFVAAAERPDCQVKPLESRMLEEPQLNEIKEELLKLTELTVLLKDQQKILSVLDKGGKDFSGDLSEQYDPQDIIRMLERLENERKKTKPDIARQKELNQLQIDIQSAITTLNQTKDGLDVEKERETVLENEIIHQKQEIDTLRALLQELLKHKDVQKNESKPIDQILENNNKSKILKGADLTSENEVVGLPLFFPQNLPTFSMNKERKNENKEHQKEKERSKENKDRKKEKELKTKKVEKNTITENDKMAKPSNETMNEKGQKIQGKHLANKLEARESSGEKGIFKFLNEIENPRKVSIEEKIKEVEEKLEATRKEEALKKELVILRGLLEKEKEKPASKSLLVDEEDDDVAFLTRLQMLVKTLNRLDKPEVKPAVKIERNIEEELKKLQIAIDRLRPKDDSVNALTNIPQTKGMPAEIKTGNQELSASMTVEQLIQLKSKIDEILHDQENRGKLPFSPALSFQAQINPHLDPKKDTLPYPLWYRGTSYTGPLGPSPLDYGYPPKMYPPYYPRIDGYQPMGSGLVPGENLRPAPPIDAEIRNQFFQAPQSYPMDRPIGATNYGPEGTTGYLPPQPEYYQTKVNYNDLKTKSMDDLTQEIYALENIITTMNAPPYNGKYEDKAELNRLEQEIQGLKVAINSLNQDIKPKGTYKPETPIQSPHYPPSQTHIPERSTRHKRSIEPTNSSKRHKRSADSTDIQNPSSDIQLYDDITSKLREYFVEEDNKGRTANYNEIKVEDNKERTADYNEIKERLNRLKSQLGKSTSRTYQPLVYVPFESYQEPSYQYPSYTKSPKEKSTKIKQPSFKIAEFKKDDVMSNIIVKIVEKALAVLPQLLGKLFGIGVHTLIDDIDQNKYGKDYETGYEQNYGNYGNGVSYNNNQNLESIFYKLGVFGYIPIILLNFIKVITTVFNILRKNKFFTYTVVPTLLLLLVAGAVVFLIWWLKPDDEQKLIGSDSFGGSSGNLHALYNNYYNNYGRSSNAYSGTNYNNKYSPYLTQDYRSPYYNNYFNYYGNFDRRAVNTFSNNGRNFPGVYYRSYFDDGSKRI